MTRVSLSSALILAALAMAWIRPDAPAAAAIRPANSVTRTGARAPAAPRFVEDAGQWGGGVSFLAVGGDRTVALGPRSMTLVQHSGAQRCSVEYAFEGARDVRPRGESPTRVMQHYFHGSTTARHARTFSSVAYEDVWPGIGVRFDARPSAVEYSLVVAPGADADAARFRVTGAERVATTVSGALAVTSAAGTVTHSRPVAWQEIGGRRRDVDVAFDVGPRGDDGTWTYGFALGEHDPSRAVVVDPTFVMESFDTGLVSGDYLQRVAVTSSGEVYAVGTSSWSGAVPAAKAGFDATLAGVADAWVGKFDAEGQLLWATFIGGVGNGQYDEDWASDVGVDDEGRAVVFGSTTASDFPATLPPLTSSTTGAWLARLAADGSSIVHAQVLGGSLAGALAVGADGAAYVAWRPSSATLPVTTRIGPAANVQFGVVAKFSKSGAAQYVADLRRTAATQPGYTTYFNGAAVDAAGSVYVTGTAYGVDSLPPATVTNTYGGGVQDAFVLKVAPGGTSLDYAFYVGGSSYDEGAAIAVSQDGTAYVVGHTSSSITTFQSYDPSRPGPANNFIARVPPSGAVLGALLPLPGPCGGGCIYDYGIDLDALGSVLVNVEYLYVCPADLASGELVSSTYMDGPPRFAPSGEFWAPRGRQIAKYSVEAVQPPPAPASIPVSVAAEATSPRTAHITWIGAGNESGFTIERSRDGGEFVFLADVSGATTSFDDQDLAPDAGYSYRVVARTPTSSSAPSSVATIRTPATLRLRVKRARVRDRAAANTDSVGFAAAIRFLAGAGSAGYHPQAHDLRIALGDVFVLDVPAGDPGWSEQGGVPVWTGSLGGSATATLVVDFPRRRIALKATGLDLDATLVRTIDVSLRIGDDAGSQSLTWRSQRASFQVK